MLWKTKQEQESEGVRFLLLSVFHKKEGVTGNSFASNMKRKRF